MPASRQHESVFQTVVAPEHFVPAKNVGAPNTHDGVANFPLPFSAQLRGSPIAATLTLPRWVRRSCVCYLIAKFRIVGGFARKARPPQIGFHYLFLAVARW